MNEGFWFLRIWFLLLLLPVAIGFIAILHKRIVPEFYWPMAGILPKSGNKNSFFRVGRAVILLLVAVAFVFISAGFFSGEKVTHENLTNYVIVLIQDRSGSMFTLLDALGKVSAALIEIRPKDKFCGVYFSETAVRTACGESAKVITEVKNEDLGKSLSLGSTSIGTGTEPGAGLLKGLETVIDEAGIFDKRERDSILSNLESNKTPFIPEDKVNSHTGFIAILQSDALFPDKPLVDPVKIIGVMARLGVRVYFVVFTKERAESVINAIRNTGGKTYFIDPDLAAKKSLLEKELNTVFNDINTLNPRRTSVISGIEPRKFTYEIGWSIVILLAAYIFSYLIEEIILLIMTKIRSGKEENRQ